MEDSNEFGKLLYAETDEFETKRQRNELFYKVMCFISGSVLSAYTIVSIQLSPMDFKATFVIIFSIICAVLTFLAGIAGPHPRLSKKFEIYQNGIRFNAREIPFIPFKDISSIIKKNDIKSGKPYLLIKLKDEKKYCIGDYKKGETVHFTYIHEGTTKTGVEDYDRVIEIILERQKTSSNSS